MSDRITVLRRGRVIGTVRPEETTKEELIRMMIGRELVIHYPTGRVDETRRKILEVKDLHALDDRGLPVLNGCTFDVREGEILGIAGVSGNGQKELAEVIMGLRKATKGKVIINGRDMTNKPTWEILRMGVSCIPESRVEGSMLTLSVAENLILYSYKSFLNKYRLLDYDKIYKHARELIKEFNIVTPHELKPAATLSGGNLQRMIVARALSQDFKLLIACHPTVGLDVASITMVHQKLIEKRNKGAAILLISEDLDEIMSLSDRVAVIFKGKIVGIVPKEKADKYEIGAMMTGAKVATTT